MKTRRLTNLERDLIVDALKTKLAQTRTGERRVELDNLRELIDGATSIMACDTSTTLRIIEAEQEQADKRFSCGHCNNCTACNS